MKLASLALISLLFSAPAWAGQAYERLDLKSLKTTAYFRAGPAADAPILLLIQGSGCGSIVASGAKPESKIEFSVGSFHEKAVQAAGSGYAILAVEKPFVEAGVQAPAGGDKACRAEYRREFSRDQWVGRLKSALKTVIRARKLVPQSITVAGYSEGAEVAAFLAAEVPEVKVVISVAGGGALRLFEQMLFAAKSGQVSGVLKTWAEIMSEPLAWDRYAWDHTYLYWSSWAKSSPMESLKKSRAKVYVIQGTSDDIAPVESGDWMVAELIVARKELHYERVTGADHGLQVGGKSQMLELLQKAFAWAQR